MAETLTVLMCGGRRTGKTSIMAAMQKDMQNMFAGGSIVLQMENSSSLVLYQQEQERLFSVDNLDKMSYYASDNETGEREEYGCRVTLRGDYKSPISLNFIDIPGEWFVTVEHEKEVQKLMEDSQILVIAVDSPHLVEKDGCYHEVFNRPTEITDMIKRAFQGNEVCRLVLFVPVKCELYENNRAAGRRKNMKDLLACVKDGYSDLLTYLETSQKKNCTVAVSPCITMGGLEFLQFVAPVDEDGQLVTDRNGKPLPDIMINTRTGNRDMMWLSEYTYLYDENGDHYYRPANCAQPLLNILLFFVAMGRLRARRGGFLGRLLGRLFHCLPKQEILDNSKADLLRTLKTSAEEGYEIINDPLGMMK